MLATTSEGTLTHLLGAMGGDAQPQINLQVLARMLRCAQDPATAIAAGRVVLDAPSAGPFRLWWGDDLGVCLEAHAPSAWTEGLTERGHRVRGIGAFDPTTVGCSQIIAVVTNPSPHKATTSARPTRVPPTATRRVPEGHAGLPGRGDHPTAITTMIPSPRRNGLTPRTASSSAHTTMATRPTTKAAVLAVSPRGSTLGTISAAKKTPSEALGRWATVI